VRLRGRSPKSDPRVRVFRRCRRDGERHCVPARTAGAPDQPSHPRVRRDCEARSLGPGFEHTLTFEGDAALAITVVLGLLAVPDAALAWGPVTSDHGSICRPLAALPLEVHAPRALSLRVSLRLHRRRHHPGQEVHRSLYTHCHHWRTGGPSSELPDRCRAGLAYGYLPISRATPTPTTTTFRSDW
jgi:hypothetical protein